MIIYILEKTLLSMIMSMTGTSLSAVMFKCMEVVLLSPSVTFTASPTTLIATPVCL